MNTNTTTNTNTTETSVATESTATIYLDKYGFIHTSREEAIEANRA